MKTVRVVAAVIKAVNDKKEPIIFATQRGYGEFKDGWEFPGGKIEAGETPQEALKREIMEELDTEVKVGTLIDTIEYDYPNFHLSMDCFWCEILSGDLVLKEHDVKVITDLMMGGDGTNTDGELGELHLSAISEAMNQMMGSAATSLSTLLQTVIDISPPESTLFDLTEIKDGKEISPFLGGAFVKIAFRMQIDDLVDSSIMQLYPIDFARKLVETFINTQMGALEGSTEQAPAQPANQASTPAAPAQQSNAGQMNAGAGNMAQMNMQQPDPTAMNGMNQMGNMGMNGMNPMMGQMGMGNNPMAGMNQMGMNGMNSMNGMGMMNQMGNMGMPQQNVNVQPAQFQSFSNDSMGVNGQENIGLIKDVPLEVTVELGRTTKSISEILEFSPGTIIELDRIAGEPIDVLVNGKFVAKGEVVVIEESFGVRITEIIK